MTKKKGQVEIKKHFFYKMGRPNFSSVEFGCEISDVCNREDAASIGKNMYRDCEVQVRNDIGEFLAGVAAKEKAEIKADKDKAAGKSEKKAVKAEKKEEAKQTAELEAGDVEIVASESEEYINSN